MTTAHTATAGGHPPHREEGRPAVVVTDLDGTLLRSDGGVSPRTAGALRAAAEAGTRIVYATARPAWSARAAVAAVAVEATIISSNGAVVSDAATGRTLRVRAMDPARVRAAIAALRALGPGTVWAADRQHDRLLSPAWPGLLASTGTHVVHTERVPDGEPVLCLMVTGGPDDPGAALRALPELQWTSSQPGLLEVSDAGADKLSALDWVLAKEGLTRADVLAFGDGENDLALLKAAGYGVAMANACRPLLDIADETTLGHDEDGVAHCLETRFR
ncbi:HAD-IIB family hydrolase (plasmid) [Streptomyces sp. NBC_01591]|uniref:HAD family hydrolase n=1 Tax=Streptomyces sp. NBC_01591 TaxID=2975888 RepID=UPI002DD93158|nr:HAD-IIB family hydrolase [Streptomyces sp. NBC_01591]WSD74037.1 HAD-IIB family hydrolase [Streptomyces sp. NBC_01591]